jgi:hypothetical protein
MNTRARTAGLLAVALLALPGSAAGDGPSPGVAAAQSGPKDYSRNSATGDFAGARDAATAQGLRTSSLAGTSSPPRAERRRAADVDNPWPEIGAGFVGGCLVAGGAAIVALRSRRTRVAA